MTDLTEKRGTESPVEDSISHEHGINASGHVQELERNFSFWSIVGLALTPGNTWTAFGGSLTIAIYNGGSPGVIYEFIAVSIFYWFIAASIAELASAMPSAGGVYHWASVLGGKRVGFFAGWWNLLAWVLGQASMLQILAAQLTSMYAVTHPSFVTERWHVFLTYLLCALVLGAFVMFCNSALPRMAQLGGFLIVAGVFITIVICAVMPGTSGNGYASSSSVWSEWVNSTGYSRDGFVFLAGMLNGAFAVGTPDVTSHLAEEIPNPSRNIPKAVLIQYIVGFVSAVCYCIVILYAITDLDAVFNQPYFFTLTAIYEQATGSAAGTVGLLLVAMLPTVICVAGIWLTTSRMLWTLARDGATPASSFLGRVNPRTKTPLNAVATCVILDILLGCIYMGSQTAFSAFVGSFAVLGFLSYISAILPHLLRKRSAVQPGPFFMGRAGFAVNAVTCLFIIAFAVIFCFPFSLPVTAKNMNYTSLMAGGCTIFVAIFWAFKRDSYEGPRYVSLVAEALEMDAV